MRILQVSLLVVYLTGCTKFEHVQRLEGVASVSSTASGVNVRPNPVLQVGVPAEGVISLADGDEASFGDGYHVMIRLRYLGTQGQGHRFRHETIHIPPGLQIEKDVRHVLVPAYEADSPNRRLQLTDDARE